MSAEALASTIATKGFAGLMSNLASVYVKKATKFLTSDEKEIKTDLSDHFQNTFNKCFEIKTILSDKKSEKTLDLYVDQYFKLQENEVDQYSLVETIKRGCAAILTGTGGGGKSMFMRYLWLSMFEDSRGKIPFFLELRQLNFTNHQNISDFIFHSIVKSGSSISQSNFNTALKSGEFVLFLDGFDEINHDIRDKIENMLIELRENHPDLTIIVTSRPDDRFMGWHQFEIYEVMPLKKPQVLELIRKSPYPEEYREAFIDQIDHLYESHNSFLSTPLLAHMMLVTFSYNRDIPNKMYLFYEQAFDALYARHDLTKGGYKRKFYTGLDRQVFIRLVSFFCLKGYYDQRFEFTEEELNFVIDQAKSIEGFVVKNADLIKDMSESVCLLKKEGIVYSFTHRSFQEYFSAYCISRVATRNVEKLFLAFSGRYNDNVMEMVYDMNVDLFREKYLIPMRNKYTSFFHLDEKADLLKFFLKISQGSVTYLVPPYAKKKRAERHAYGFENFSGENELYHFYLSIMWIIPTKESLTIDINEVTKFDSRFGRAVSDAVKPAERLRLRLTSDGRTFYLQGLEGLDEKKKLEFMQQFLSGGFLPLIMSNIDRFFSFVNTECDRYNKVSASFDDFFY